MQYNLYMAKVKVEIKGLMSCDKCKKILGVGERYFSFGQGIHFCEECYLNLSCTICFNKIEDKSFTVYYCSDCKSLHIECEDCMKTRLKDEEKQKIWLNQARKINFVKKY